jgi:hypothetical protein
VVCGDRKLFQEVVFFHSTLFWWSNIGYEPYLLTCVGTGLRGRHVPSHVSTDGKRITATREHVDMVIISA